VTGAVVMFPSCEECAREGVTVKRASWFITVTAGYPGKGSRRMPACDLHAQWYLRQSREIYPVERLPQS
jgi:hypothetical protein